MSRPLTAVVVDDEPPARRRIVELLERARDVEVSGEFDNAAQARDAIEREAPDLLFLDVQMPETDGFGLLDELDRSRMPVTIFVTAYDSFALRAFEAEALDYLLKPFSDERFEAALERARERVVSRERAALGARVLRMLDSARGRAGEGSGRLAIRSAGRVVFLDVDEIDWVEAAGVYVNLHVGEREILARESLASLSERLEPARFVRIHRSTLVALDRVSELRFDDRGSCRVLLRSGASLRVSRSHREELESRLSRR